MLESHSVDPIVAANPRIDSVILKVASRCNLNCSYCYLYNHEDQSYRGRPAFISEQVFSKALSRMVSHCERHAPHRLSVMLHGGEPLLIGDRRLERYIDEARAVLGSMLRSISIQTNATLLTNRWAEFFVRKNVDVSVSLDGPAEFHDAVRKDHKGRDSHAKVVEGIRRLFAAGLNPYVLCVVQPGRVGSDVFNHLLDLGVKRFDLLLPDLTHESRRRVSKNLGPTPVADYLLPVFDLWLERNDPTIEIRLFQNLLRVLLGDRSRSDTFGNSPLNYISVDTDGAIEALDVLRICEDGLSASGLNVQTHTFDEFALGNPLFYGALTSGFPLPVQCQACPEVATCKGGYPPHRYSRERQFDNPSVWCSDIKLMIAHMRRILAHHGYL